MGALWGSTIGTLIYINDAPGYADLFAFHLVEATGEPKIKQGHQTNEEFGLVGDKYSRVSD